MIRSTILLALVAFVAAAPADPAIKAVLDEFKSIVPEEIRDLFKSLTPEEKQALKEVILDENVKDEKQALEELKAKSPALYEKAAPLSAALHKKIEPLTGDSKKFILGLLRTAKKAFAKHLAGEAVTADQLKALIGGQVKLFDALPDASKAELKTAFPKVASVIGSDTLQAFIKSA